MSAEDLPSSDKAVGEKACQYRVFWDGFPMELTVARASVPTGSQRLWFAVGKVWYARPRDRARYGGYEYQVTAKAAVW